MEEPKEIESQSRVEITTTGTSEEISEPSIESKVEKHSEQKYEEQLNPLIEMVSVQVKLSEQIKALLEERLSYDVAKEKTIDKISEELKTYKDNFFFQLQKPIFVELIMLYDSLERIINSHSLEQDLPKEQVATLSNNISNIREELLEILYRRDVVPFEDHPDFLDYKLHKTVKTIPTSEESENNKVEKIVKAGFRWNDKVLRPEEVIIKKYIKSKA